MSVPDYGLYHKHQQSGEALHTLWRIQSIKLLLTLSCAHVWAASRVHIADLVNTESTPCNFAGFWAVYHMHQQSREALHAIWREGSLKLVPARADGRTGTNNFWSFCCMRCGSLSKTLVVPFYWLRWSDSQQQRQKFCRHWALRASGGSAEALSKTTGKHLAWADQHSADTHRA